MKKQFSLLAAIIFATAATFTPRTAFADDDFLDSISQQLRFREAYSYRYKVEQRSVAVGVETFGKKEQQRILGDKTGDFVTLDVAVTNDTPIRVHLNDIYVVSKGKPARQQDLNFVVKDVGPGGGGKGNLRMSILRKNLFEKSLHTGVIEPGETVQGIVFIKKKHLRKSGTLHVRVQNLRQVAYLSYKIPFRVE
ncbi:hypothetical protein [Kordiimonas sp.]|uniref:hypothetical protein n=1 Tax=Kordiimonas sp. TaxID=1970157 RepID=UPI003A90639F